MKSSEVEATPASPSTESLPSLESQHVALRALGEQLADVLDALCRHPRIRTGRSDDRWLNEKLDEFRRVLFSHFEWEERSGLFAGIVAQAPRLAKQASSVVAEHRRLRGELDGLIEENLQGAGERHVRDRFHRIRLRLVYHDYAESSLLQRAYLEDLGGGD